MGKVSKDVALRIWKDDDLPGSGRVLRWSSANPHFLWSMKKPEEVVPRARDGMSSIE
jgi:hypothetical protein